MKLYIKQLLADIQQACLKVAPPHPVWEQSEADPDNELELEDISFVEQYVYGTAIPVEKITDIAFAALPPPEKLRESQSQTLAKALIQLLDHHHFQLEFPEKYPMKLRYAFIRDFWATKQVPLSYGTNHIEFCDYEKENCPFPGYCNGCDEVEAQMEADGLYEKNNDTDWDIDMDGFLPTNEALRELYGDLPADMNKDDEGIEMVFGDSLDFLGPGLFDKDYIQPEMMPIPGLCLVCLKYKEEMEDDEENMQCELLRYMKKDDDHFGCDMFEPL